MARGSGPAGPVPEPSIPPPTESGGVSPWQPATVASILPETPRARTYILALMQPSPFRAGQHYDVRLTAPDGYQAQRSYSVASAPGELPGRIALTIELIDDGEVSPYFHQVVQPGDVVEVRGPIGGPFTWEPATEASRPLLLAAGGSGVVPLRSILACREEAAPAVPALLLYSARSREDIIYRQWLETLPDRSANCAERVSPSPAPSRRAGLDMRAGLTLRCCGNALMGWRAFPVAPAPCRCVTSAAPPGSWNPPPMPSCPSALPRA